MQIRALYDKTGRILAAVQMKTDEAGGVSAPPPQPQPRPGQSVGVFEVPADCSRLSFQDACAQLEVKSEGDKAVLVARPIRPDANRA
jgi:hypothetical protein